MSKKKPPKRSILVSTLQCIYFFTVCEDRENYLKHLKRVVPTKTSHLNANSNKGKQAEPQPKVYEPVKLWLMTPVSKGVT